MTARGALCVAAVLAAQIGLPPETWAQAPIFRSNVELVSVTAVVRDGRGRPVRELTRDDFEVFDEGQPRPIVQFWADQTAALSLALLLDVSGSMRLGSKMTDAKDVGNQLFARLRDGTDEAAVFAFDSELKELQPYTTDPSRLQQSLIDTHPFGATSLYDAIAETARRASARDSRHRAVVVLSDGVDTDSELSAPEVSGIASAIDVPVYVIAIVSPLDHPEAKTRTEAGAGRAGQLRDLARWTGGGVYFVATPAEAVHAAIALINELRHQYVLAFEPAAESGWRRIEVRVPDVYVKTRSAYLAQD